MTTTDRQAAIEAMASTDWSGGTVETDAKPRKTSIVHSVRVDDTLDRWIAAEADRRGVTPAVIIRDALTAASQATAADEPVVVRRGDIHRVIDNLLGTGRPRTA